MKKLISLLLVLVMIFTPITAYAADTDKAKEKEDKTSIRHQVYKDVSEIEVGKELDKSESNADKTEAKIGTDIYLFVDPDTASLVIFKVTDEEGNPIEGADIWIQYKDYKEYYGNTNKNGVLAIYLFRDVEYGYTVEKEGYETVTGEFIATKEIKQVRVVMRKYYDLDIFVVDGDKPVPGITVIIDGNEYTTDENGKVTVPKTNGVYEIVLVTPDGRRIQKKVTVNGDSVVVIDIGSDSTLVSGGKYSDRFLVYNRDYDPEDYVLTKYLFDEDDVSKADSEKYLAETSNTILVQAQPERKQHSGKADTDVLDKNGNTLYAQRSLMPSGFLLKAWQEEGYEKLVFTNEEMAIAIPMDALHSGDMMKLYGIIEHLDDWRVKLEDIADYKTLRKGDGLEQAGLYDVQRWSVETDFIDFTALKDFVFRFEEDEQPRARIIADEYYTNSLFEFRLTPILPGDMLNMLSDGLTGHQAMAMDEIMLASWGYYDEELRRAAAKGYLTESEYDELYALFVDSKLSKAEIQELRDKKASKQLSDAQLQLLLDAAADEKLYRVSCWLSYEDIVVDITGLIEGLEFIRNVDRQFENELEQLRTEDKKADEAELIARAEKALEETYEFTMVGYQPRRYSVEEYKPGEFTKTTEAKLVCSLDEDSDFYGVISEKDFEQLTVDVRKGNININGSKPRFTAEMSSAQTKLELHRALTAPWNGITLSLLTYR